MFRTRSLMVALLVIAVGLTACSGMDVYPPPRPIDLPVGLEEGLISRDWDGGHPMRYLAFLSNPVGVVLDLFVNQPLYMLFALDPELFGYTNQDELYRKNFSRYRYSWPSFEKSWSASSSY